MAKALTRLRLLVSCSSELQAERGLLEKVVDDVNRTVEEAYGVTLRTIDWKRDIIPGAGVDPQQVINSQSTDYEIYFGMLGTRFGTPTPRAGSGTEDEFNAAYKRFRKDPQSVRLLVYFRTGFAGGLMDVDPDQLRRVQEFRARLGQEAGLLFCDFAVGEEFMQLCRHHLIQLIATQWAGERWNAVPGLAPTDDAIDHLISGEPASADDDEPGLLDLRVRQDEACESAMSAVRQIADLMSTWADADRQWTTKLQAATAQRVSAKEAHTIINLKAADFSRRAKELRPLRATYKASSEDFFAALTQLVEFQIANNISTPEEMKAGLQHIVAIDSVVRAARDTYVSVAASLARLPEPTREFRSQKRSLMQQVEKLSADIGAWLDRSSELRSRFELDGNGGVPKAV